MRLQVLLMLFVALVFSACAKTVYVDREVEVLVPVVQRVPEVTCNFNQEIDSDVVIELYRCIYDTREVCYGRD